MDVLMLIWHEAGENGQSVHPEDRNRHITSLTEEWLLLSSVRWEQKWHNVLETVVKTSHTG